MTGTAPGPDQDTMSTSDISHPSQHPENLEYTLIDCQYVDVQPCEVPSSEAETVSSIDSSDKKETVDLDEEISRKLSAVTISEPIESEDSVELRRKRAMIHDRLNKSDSNDHLTKCIKHLFSNMDSLDADAKADRVLGVMFPNLSCEMLESVITGKNCTIYRRAAIINAIIHENDINDEFFLLCIAAAYGGRKGIQRFKRKWCIDISFKELHLCSRDQQDGLKGLVIVYLSIIGHVLIYMRSYRKGRSYFNKRINRLSTREVTLQEIGRVTIWSPVIFDISTPHNPRKIKKRRLREYETSTFPFNRDIVDEIIKALFGRQVNYM
ncbi:unnamed protein product [Cyberlindnera jadinii]|uniref:Uncharacterized protein n=1 Tax=Cyberlindnera jadinii (strain ATCC 18201 / CBS 1600 / BCRC 20928 / JCM 3617 / NBRC 0987 / NRRL Y-1542) TaxID=983966 RepID=A0A0H5C7J2_CYBJN|nr:unnamed protein product [Cyberlindnera jadinii]